MSYNILREYPNMYEDANGVMVPSLHAQRELYHTFNRHVQDANVRLSRHESIPVGIIPPGDTSKEDTELNTLLAEYGL